MRKVFIVLIILLVANVSIWYWYFKIHNTSHESESSVSVTSELVDVFIFALEEEVDKKVGAPLEGYEPKMFLSVFPGLTETDFDGVKTSSGSYKIKNGRLVHELDQDALLHSAAAAINRRGMEILLLNIASRAEIDLTKDGTITDVMRVLTRTQ